MLISADYLRYIRVLPYLLYAVLEYSIFLRQDFFGGFISTTLFLTFHLCA